MIHEKTFQEQLTQKADLSSRLREKYNDLQSAVEDFEEELETADLDEPDELEFELDAPDEILDQKPDQLGE